MQAFKKMRLFHWLLAILFIAAYLTGDGTGLAHVWFGYGLIVLLAIRLLLALKKTSGFPSLLPRINVLRFSRVTVVGSLLTFTLLLTLTGTLWMGAIMVDNGKVLNEGVQNVLPVEIAFASPVDTTVDDSGVGVAGAFIDWIKNPEEIHEYLANLALFLVGAHIVLIMLFRRRQAWMMLFGSKRTAQSVIPVDSSDSSNQSSSS